LTTSLCNLQPFCGVVGQFFSKISGMMEREPEYDYPSPEMATNAIQLYNVAMG
jgi:hypothetical protein